MLITFIAFIFFILIIPSNLSKIEKIIGCTIFSMFFIIFMMFVVLLNYNFKIGVFDHFLIPGSRSLMSPINENDLYVFDKSYLYYNTLEENKVFERQINVVSNDVEIIEAKDKVDNYLKIERTNKILFVLFAVDHYKITIEGPRAKDFYTLREN